MTSLHPSIQMCPEPTAALTSHLGEEEGWSPFFWIKCPWNVTKLRINLSYISFAGGRENVEWRHYLYPKWILEYNRKNKMTKENLVWVLVSKLCNPADTFSCRRVLCKTTGGFSLHTGMCLGCVERMPHPIQFPAEEVKGYQPPCPWKRLRKMLTKPHEPAIKIEEKCIKNLGMKDVSVVT